MLQRWERTNSLRTALSGWSVWTGGTELAEPTPLIGTYLMSRADKASPVASAVVRGFLAQLSEAGNKDLSTVLVA